MNRQINNSSDSVESIVVEHIRKKGGESPRKKDESRTLMDRFKSLRNPIWRKNDRSPSGKRRASMDEERKKSSNEKPSRQAIRKDIGELMRYLTKRHVTLIFWVRFGARLCMALLYIAMAVNIQFN